MKNIKKVFVAALTLITSFIMLNAVSATETTGSIEIKGTTKGKVYEVYKIFDLTYSGTTPNLKVAYTINSKWEGFFASATGSKYIVTLENDTDGNIINPNNLNAITVKKAPSGYETKYINITEENVATFVTEALAYLGTTPITKTKDITATGTTTTIDELKLGYYLVYPEGATEIDKAQYASIASLTSTTPTAEVNIKATYPTITKTGDGPSYEVGKYATFTITGKVPDTTGFNSYTYKIHDSWTAGLEYVESEFQMTVTVGNDNVTVNSQNLTLNKDTNNNVTGFTLSIDAKNTNYEVGDTITVVYKVLVNKDAINSTTTNNHAYLEYSNNPQKDTTSKTQPIEVPVYSSAIKVVKYAGESCSGEPRICTTPLSGAKFVLKNSEGKYYSATFDNNNVLTKITWVDFEDANVFTTDEEGILTYENLIGFQGLEDGNYEIIETEAPLGYNKLADSIEVELTGAYDRNQRQIPVEKELTVENNTGTQLPSTGGFGTKMFILLGSLLAVVSAVVLVTNKRMSKEYL